MDVFKAQFQKFCAILRKRGRSPDEAEDLVQEAFVKMLTYIDKGERVLKTEAFLARAVFNASIDLQRREHTELYESRSMEELLLLPALTASPQEEAENEECLHRTQEILDRALGERARKVFFLHCFEGLTYDEIAKQIKMSRRTVEKDLAKAINVLCVHNLPPL